MSKKTEIKNFVGRKIKFLQSQAETGEGKGMLANLRRGVGCELGEVPQLFGLVLLDMPETFLSRDGKATKEEWACYTALTLYALHQQGFDIKEKSMHIDENVSIGRSLLFLSERQEDSNREKRAMQKLQTLITSQDRKEISYHLKGLVQMLSREGIPLNYTILAADLFEIQNLEGKKRVSMRWGQDFYTKRNQKGRLSNE